jgi:hypothetical protein
MNELLSCYEQLDVPVFYTDTDSIHISHKRIMEVVEAYNKKYGRELIPHNQLDADDGDLG